MSEMCNDNWHLTVPSVGICTRHVRCCEMDSVTIDNKTTRQLRMIDGEIHSLFLNMENAVGRVSVRHDAATGS